MKKIWAIAVSAMLLLGALSFVGCAQKDNPHGYDANIVVQSSHGDEWLFTPETEEQTAEYEYTGEEIEFRVAKYQFKFEDKSTVLYETWLKSGNDLRFYYDEYEYFGEDGTRQRFQREGAKYCAKDKGKYIFKFRTSGEGFMKYREFNLILTVV